VTAHRDVGHVVVEKGTAAKGQGCHMIVNGRRDFGGTVLKRCQLFLFPFDSTEGRGAAAAAAAAATAAAACPLGAVTAACLQVLFLANSEARGKLVRGSTTGR
jgi:hypothetical protein